MSISQPPTLCHQQSRHLSQHIPHVPPRALVVHHRGLIHLLLPRRPRYALSPTNVLSCSPLLERRRKPSQRHINRRGLSLSSTSSSDCFPKFLTAKKIGTNDPFVVARVRMLNKSLRWSKISKAMGGRRTPRQVASRVQKYFEKLKLFGVKVEQA